MRSTRHLLLVVCLLGAGSRSLDAQKPAPEPGPAPTFTSRADLVVVPVQLRRGSEHVAGLTRESFTVLQDGQEQKVAVFEEIRTSTQRLRRLPVGPGEFTNQLQGDPSAARYTVIAIDKITTAPIDMQRLREGLLKFLSQATDSGEPVRLVAINPSSLEVIQDFTTDPKALAAALKRAQTPAGKEGTIDNTFNETLRQMAASAEVEADAAAQVDGGESPSATALVKALDAQKQMEQQTVAFRDRATRMSSLEALQQIAQSLSGLPGRKSLVWASSGYPFTGISTEGRTSVSFEYGRVVEATGLDEYTTHLLNTANIALYPVDARGAVNTSFQVMDPSRKYSPTAAETEGAQMRNQDVITTFEHLASATGGKPCYGRADLSGCFKDALDDARDYYLVGYYINRQKIKPGWHKISVKVAEKGVSIRARNGFLLPKFGADQTRGSDMRLALSSRLIDPGIPFLGRWGTATPKGDKRTVPLQLHILGSAGLVGPDQPQMNLDIAAIARKRDGTTAGQIIQRIERQLPPEAAATVQKAGISYKNTLEVPPGEYLVRIVVRDNVTGRMGSASSLLKVE